MKRVYTIAALAFCVAAGGLGMTGAAQAQAVQPSLRGNYCAHSDVGATDSCGYVTIQQCAKYAKPMAGWCTYNGGRLAYRRDRPAYGWMRG